LPPFPDIVIVNAAIGPTFKVDMGVVEQNILAFPLVGRCIAGFIRVLVCIVRHVPAWSHLLSICTVDISVGILVQVGVSVCGDWTAWVA